MHIPEKIKVGGQMYEVELVDEIRDMMNPVGRIDVRSGLIELRDTENEDFLNATFLHEVVHALHNHMGVAGEEVCVCDETYVDGFANALYMVIKDNPSLFHKH